MKTPDTSKKLDKVVLAGIFASAIILILIVVFILINQ